MTKVYVVRYGEYSDQGISGVFSTKEKAQKYCDIQNELKDYEDYWIDERELDKDVLPNDTKVVTYYGCTVYLNDSLYIKKGAIDTEDMEEKRIYIKDVEVEVQTGEDKAYEYIEVWSVKGTEHAKKVALDDYYKYIAKKEGIS